MGIRIVSVVGDSHIWGEGVGAERHFDPPVCCGDLRPLPFSAPSYVNLLRDRLNRETGSVCSEYEGEALTSLCEARAGNCGVVASQPMRLFQDFELARVFFRAEAEEAVAELDAVSEAGEVTVTETLYSASSAMNQCIRVAHIFAPRGETAKRLLIRCPAGRRLLVYRVELYRGAYALLNCGVGSCPVGRFKAEYLHRYVASLSPYAILFEGCTINDWLLTPSPAQYAEELRGMLAAQRELTSKLLWHTVTPIAGSRVSGQGTVYDDYVDAMRSVAIREGVALVDCHAEMEALLSAMPEEARIPYFYHDPWHPNGEGHRLYAEAVYPALRALL